MCFKSAKQRPCIVSVLNKCSLLFSLMMQNYHEGALFFSWGGGWLPPWIEITLLCVGDVCGDSTKSRVRANPTRESEEATHPPSQPSLQLAMGLVANQTHQCLALSEQLMAGSSRGRPEPLLWWVTLAVATVPVGSRDSSSPHWWHPLCKFLCLPWVAGYL